MKIIDNNSNNNTTFEDIKHIEKMALNFGMLESLCMF